MASNVESRKIKQSKLIIGLFSIQLFFGHYSSAQDEWVEPETGWLFEVMPAAQSFSEKVGDPPVFRAYSSTNNQSESNLIGYVFTTPDVPPEEAGFSGPIDLLVGMNLTGEITGVKVLFYRESHKHVRGPFIENSGIVEQFSNKPIGDEFRVGQDVDGIATATITSWAVSRGLRNAARRVAVAYLPDASYTVEANTELAALRSLQAKTWAELFQEGYLKQLVVPIEGEQAINFSVAYMGHFRLGEMLIGDEAYSNTDRTASSLGLEGHMLFIGLDGNTARLEQARLGVSQDGVIYPNSDNGIVFAGAGDDGKAADQISFAVAMIIDPDIRINQPFQLLYDTGPVGGQFEDYVAVNYSLPSSVLTLLGSTEQSSGYDPDDINQSASRSLSQILLVVFSLMVMILALKRRNT